MWTSTDKDTVGGRSQEVDVRPSPIHPQLAPRWRNYPRGGRAGCEGISLGSVSAGFWSDVQWLGAWIVPLAPDLTVAPPAVDNLCMDWSSPNPPHKESKKTLSQLVRGKEGMRGPDVHKPLLAVLEGHRSASPPIWMMRQAGRYLPEYRAVREKAGSFLNLCFNPELATEVTLQPLRRFGFDGAILFSDILVVPHALGQAVRFETGEGPRLDPLNDASGLSRLSGELDAAIVGKVYEAVAMIRSQLPPQATLIGFCGAPWTVATYMVAGRGGDDQVAARLFAYRDPEGFTALIDRIVDASINYLLGQIAAGVEAVQIFDTWAGVLPDEQFVRWSVEPIARIVRDVRAGAPGIPVIVFPKGAGQRLSLMVREAWPDAVGLDWTAGRDFIREQVQPHVAVQGNIDPIALLAGGEALDRAVDTALESYGPGRYIFNLGHGILPPTPIAHVERMIARVRSWRLEA